MKDAAGRSLVVFTLDGQRYALPLSSVGRALRAVAITPLSGAPAVVRGIVNLGGSVLPVIDLRLRCGHPTRDLRLSDHLIVASTPRRRVALLVDEPAGVIERADGDRVGADEILPHLDLVAGAAKLDDGLILIHDLGRLLSLDDEDAIDQALACEAGRGVG